MIGVHNVKTDGWAECEMSGLDHEGNPTTKCDVNDFIEQLKETQAKLDVKMEYLLGFNEPWDTHESSYDWKYIAPADAAKYWGEYYIPTAKALDLKLGTPTTIMNFNKIDWMVEFIQACWELRDADENPCDVESIEVFNMHHYTCYYQGYYDKYDVNSTTDDSFYQYLINALTDSSWEGSTQFEWENFIKGIPIWFSETSCEQESTTRLSNVEECLRITGQETTGSWGSGSIQAIKEIDNIHRVAWFTAYTTTDQANVADTAMLN